MTSSEHRYKVVIVGAGFAGLGASIRLLEAGHDDFVVLERSEDVGGTWRDNTYPGCQCDVPSHLYSFSFAPNPDWSRTYSMQTEIDEYLRRTARERGVLPYVRFNTRMLDARWNETQKQWEIETSTGSLKAEVLVMGNGPLSEPRLPDVPGLDRFRGASFHSAGWDHGHDLSEERVAVVGTGASTVQFFPHVRDVAKEVVLFQRTPPWVLPHPDRPISARKRRMFRKVPGLQRLERAWIYLSRESWMVGFAKFPPAMKIAERIGLRHIRRQVSDPALRRKLTPGYRAGCKRIVLSNDWYRSLAQPNVTVVSAGLKEVRDHSVIASDGTEHHVDTIIFGTGFHVTDNPIMEHLYGTGGRRLSDFWAQEGMSAYKGATVPGFPNLFFLAGPNTGIGHTSLLVMIEAQIRYFIGALSFIERENAAAIEVRGSALAAYSERLQRRLSNTVWSTGGCSSWYMDSKGRNPTIWPDFTWRFTLATSRFDPAAYLVRYGRPSAHEGTPLATAEHANV
jgi:cation diffusion facilitator CzcD-associated flavoprotein CzcO